MTSTAARCLIVFVCLLSAAALSAQRPVHLRPGARSVVLDVVVTGKSGAPVSGLQPENFTVMDGNDSQTISSFQVTGGRSADVEVVIVVDAVNTDAEHVGHARDQVDKFLRANGGRLVFPTAVELLTDKGRQSQGEYSFDGNALSAALDKAIASLPSSSSAGISAAEQSRLSLQALHDLADHGTLYPGRKLMLWVSPGWPPSSSPNVGLDDNQRQQIFSSIVSFANLLRADHITLYSIDPSSTPDAGGADTKGTFEWKDFVKGISKPDDAQAGDLALQVLAAQSGGVALNSSNESGNDPSGDLANLLQKCVSDADAYYELSFEPAPNEKPNQYHSVEVRINKSGLTARTSQGYYSQP